jgi:NADH-quinone oxidoreductase subunit J
LAEKILFFMLAIVAIVAAVGVVWSRNPVRSALSLVVNFIALAMIYFTLHAHFLGIVQVIVYTGAIMVLFLFVIMLLNLGSPDAMQESSRWNRWIAVIAGMAMLVMLIMQVFLLVGTQAASAPEDLGTPQNVGVALLSGWVYPLQIAGLLLLVGVVGSILLAKRRRAES